MLNDNCKLPELVFKPSEYFTMPCINTFLLNKASHKLWDDME